MTAKKHREMRDNQRNIKRSRHQHFFISPSSKLGTPIYVVRESTSNDTRNYDNKIIVSKMLAMF